MKIYRSGKARLLSQKLYPLTFIEPIKLNFRFKDQIRGSVGSIMDNIAEDLKEEQIRIYKRINHRAKGEAELESQLYRGLYNNYSTQNEFEEL